MAKHSFRISSALKRIIGRDLITDDFVAVFELVKNSFDANASTVHVVFDFESAPGGAIWIVDDGVGMDQEDIFSKWLFLAYSAKREGNDRSQRASYAGYKGVGRFSCDRLGRVLQMQSRAAGDESVHRVVVKWDDFEMDSTKEFKDVDVDVSRTDRFSLPTGISPPETGVVLRITQPREWVTWNRGKLLKLRNALKKLVSPFPDDRGSCEIHLVSERDREEDEELRRKSPNVPSSRIVNGPIENDILQALHGKTTSLEASITDKGTLEVELRDRGTLIYRTTEDAFGEFGDLVGTDLRASLFYLNQAAKTTFTRRMGITPVQFGSLMLLRNGFLVYPVGEETDDYWGINRRKQQGHSRYLGSRDLLGFVSVKGDEETFRESSSRDKGLIETAAAIQLSECAWHCLLKLESYVVGITWKDKLDKEYETAERIGTDENRSRLIELVEALASSGKVRVLDYNRDLVGILREKASNTAEVLARLRRIAESQNDSTLGDQVKAAHRALRDAEKRRKEAQEEAERERQARRAAERQAEAKAREAEEAAAKAEEAEQQRDEERKQRLFISGYAARDKEALEGFLHSIVQQSTAMKSVIRSVFSETRKAHVQLPDRVVALLGELREWNDRILTTSRIATLANFRMDSERIIADLVSYIGQYIESISSAYSSVDVSTSLTESEYNCAFSPIEVGLIIDNIIANSAKARASRVFFCLTVRRGLLTMEVTDDGKGLDRSVDEPDRVFEKGFSRTSGSGLGLYVTKQVIESLGGDITIPNEQPDRGFRIVVRFAR